MVIPAEFCKRLITGSSLHHGDQYVIYPIAFYGDYGSASASFIVLHRTTASHCWCPITIGIRNYAAKMQRCNMKYKISHRVRSWADMTTVLPTQPACCSGGPLSVKRHIGTLVCRHVSKRHRHVTDRRTGVTRKRPPKGLMTIVFSPRDYNLARLHSAVLGFVRCLGGWLGVYHVRVSCQNG